MWHVIAPEVTDCACRRGAQTSRTASPGESVEIASEQSSECETGNSADCEVMKVRQIAAIARDGRRNRRSGEPETAHGDQKVTTDFSKRGKESLKGLLDLSVAHSVPSAAW